MPACSALIGEKPGTILDQPQLISVSETLSSVAASSILAFSAHLGIIFICFLLLKYRAVPPQLIETRGAGHNKGPQARHGQTLPRLEEGGLGTQLPHRSGQLSHHSPAVEEASREPQKIRGLCWRARCGDCRDILSPWPAGGFACSLLW